MFRRTLFAVFAATLLAVTHGCCLFRGFGEAIGKAMAAGLVAQSVLRLTVQLFPVPSSQRLPGLPPFLAVGQEPGPDIMTTEYLPSPTTLTLIEFGPVIRGQSVGPGVKIQIPFPYAAAKCFGPITFMNGGLRLLAPAWGPEWVNGPALARTVRDESWEQAFVRRDGWTGADGAATVPLPDNRTLWLFGDSWIGPVIDGRHAEGSAMVNNSIAVQPVGVDRPYDLRFLWGTANRKPAGWAVPAGAAKTGEWFWPATGGLVVPGPAGHDRLLLFMCRLGRRDQSDSIWNFEARGTTLLVVKNPKDPPERWRSTQHPIAPAKDPAGREIIWGGALLDADPGDLCILGIDGSNVLDKKLVAARAPATAIEHLDSWRFWDGMGWSPDPAAAAAIVHPLASELSVHRLTIAGRPRYVMVYSELTLGPRVLARAAERPEGPWSEPVALYDCPEPASDKKLMVYSAKAHPELSRPGELLISYCVNSTDFWDVAAHADKYRPRFIRVPLAMLPNP